MSVTIQGTYASYELFDYNGSDTYDVLSSCSVQPKQGYERYVRYSVRFSGGRTASSSEELIPVYGGRIGISSGATFTKTQSAQTVSVTVTIQTRVNSSGSSWQDDATYTGSVTIPARSRYTVQYNSNGGSGTPYPQTAWDGDYITIGNAPTKTGYEFAGWNTSSSGTGTFYYPGPTYRVTGNRTLYAIWGASIKFYGNGSGVSNLPDAVPKPYGEAVQIPTTIPTRSGYVFVCWNTSANGTGTRYDPNQTVPASVNDSLTLYAQWTDGPDYPVVTQLTTVRCNSDRTANTEGTCCLVTCTWRVDVRQLHITVVDDPYSYTYSLSDNWGRLSGTYRTNGGTAVSFAWDSGTYDNITTTQCHSATGDYVERTTTALIQGLGSDTQYIVRAYVVDGSGYEAERSSILTSNKYVMDFARGGQGMGIGTTAPEPPSTGLCVGFTTEFIGDVTVGGAIHNSSDRTLKEHVSYLGEDACQFVRALKPALFRMKGETRVGLYAQDVAEADEWGTAMVGTSLRNGTLTLDYIEVIAPLIAYAQALEGRIAALAARIEALEGR